MPFKSDKQRKWMHANEPDMAKKWEKEEAIKGKLQNLIKQELKINKLEAFKPKGISQFKKMVLLPKSKMYFDPTTQYFWLMGPGGEPDWEDDPIEPKDWDYKRTLSRLSSKDKSIIKKSLRGKGNWKEATTTSVVPPHDTPQAYSKSTQTAIDIDDEDDEKNESVNESTKEWGKTLDKIAKDRHLKSISKKDRDTLMKIAKLMKRANESIDESGILYRAGVKKYGKDGMKKIQQAAGKRKSHAEIGAIKDKYEKDKKESVNEARLVGYDKSYLDNAKKKLKVPHEITNIEYKKTRQHDKFVKISYKLKWKPGTRLDTEEKDVSVFYDSTERLKMIGKKLKLKLKESVNEGRKWTMYVDDKKIKTHASKRAAVIAYNKFIKDTDDWKEVSIQAESVNEATSSKDFFSGNKVTNSLPRATLSLLNSKLNKASEAIIKITDKYKKQGDIDELVKIWMRGLHLRLKKGGIKIESVNEARRVGYDKSYLDNAKKKLKVSHEITDIEYKKTRQHDKFVKISYKLKWKPGTRLDTEEKDVNVFYDSPERLKMIGKTLKLKLKESVNEKVAKPFSEHLRKAQDEIEYMISNGPTPDGDDGVYDKPNQAMKLLQIAQKSLGKIK